MNKWACFGGEAPHAQRDGGSLLLQVLCVEGWCNTSDCHGYHRSVFACSPHMAIALACHRCVAMQTSPGALSQIFHGGGVKGVKVKRRRGDHKQSEREERRSVDRRDTCSFRCSSFLWCINQKTLNPRILTHSPEVCFYIYIHLSLDAISASPKNLHE